MAKPKMTPGEALVETLVAEGGEHVFGIVYLPACATLDILGRSR